VIESRLVSLEVEIVPEIWNVPCESV